MIGSPWTFLCAKGSCHHHRSTWQVAIGQVSLIRCCINKCKKISFVADGGMKIEKRCIMIHVCSSLQPNLDVEEPPLVHSWGRKRAGGPLIWSFHGWSKKKNGVTYEASNKWLQGGKLNHYMGQKECLFFSNICVGLVICWTFIKHFKTFKKHFNLIERNIYVCLSPVATHKHFC